MINAAGGTLFIPVLSETCRYYLSSAGAGFLIGSALYLAWISTGLEPLNYYIWLVHVVQSSNRRVIQIFTLNDDQNDTYSTEHHQSNNEINNSAQNLNEFETLLTPQESGSASRRVTLNTSPTIVPNLSETGAEGTPLEQTTVVIVQTPFSVTRIANNESQSEEQTTNSIVQNINQNRRLTLEESSQSYQFELPLSSTILNSTLSNSSSQASIETNSNDNAISISEDIITIYRLLRANVDSEIATAVTIALYSRRFSSNRTATLSSSVVNRENVFQDNRSNVNPVINTSSHTGANGHQHHVLVSRVSMSVESNEERLNGQNVLISYDNLQSLPSQNLFSSNLIQHLDNSNNVSTSRSLSTNSSFVSSDSTLLPTTANPTQTANTSFTSAPVFLNNESFINVDSNETDNNTSEFRTSASSLNKNESSVFLSKNLPNTPSTSESSNQLNRNGGGANEPNATTVKSWDNTITTIRLKFLDDTQRLVKTWLETSVGDFKREHFSDSLERGNVVRLIFQGQLLRDDMRSLASYGIHDQCAVHCHVGTRPYQQQQAQVQQNQNPDSLRQSNDGSIDAFGRTTNRSFNNEQNNQRNLQGIGSMASLFGIRVLSVGSSWLGLMFLVIWNCLFFIRNWAHNVDDNNNNINDEGQQRSWLRFILDNIKCFVRVVFDCLFDPSVFTRRPPSTGRAAMNEENGFNAGTIFGFLFATKFASLWLIVLYYPQFTDFKGVVLLAILTIITFLYFFFNRSINTTRIPAFRQALNNPTQQQ